MLRDELIVQLIAAPAGWEEIHRTSAVAVDLGGPVADMVERYPIVAWALVEEPGGARCVRPVTATDNFYVGVADQFYVGEPAGRVASLVGYRRPGQDLEAFRAAVADRYQTSIRTEARADAA